MNVGDDLAFVRDWMIGFRATLQAEVGEIDAAIPALETISRGSHGWHRARRSLGDCYFQLSQYKRAIACYQEIIDAKVEVPEVEWNSTNRNLGAAYFHLGKFKRAVKHLKIVADKYASHRID